MKHIILLFTLFASALFATELLQNGNFKQAGKSAASANGWVGAYERIADGENFAVQCVRGAKSGYCEANSLPFDVKPNSDFTLIVEHKGAPAVLYAFFILSDGKNKSITASANDDAGWQSYKISGKIPVDAVQCRILLRTFSGSAPALFRAVHFDGMLPNPECAIPNAVSLLENGSFEQTNGKETDATRWRGVFVRSREMVREGKYAAKCLRTGKNYCEANSLPFAVKANTPFELSGYYCGSAPIIYAYFTLDDGKSQAIRLDKPASPDKWAFFKLSGTIPQNAVKCQVLLRTWNDKEAVFFDSVNFYGLSRLFDDAEKVVAGNQQLERRVMRARASLNMLTGSMLPYYVKEWTSRGHDLAAFPLDRQRIAANMRCVWLADTDYVKTDKVAYVRNTKGSQISFMENMGIATKNIADPPGTSGRKIIHFAASNLTLYNNPNMSLIKDPDAREGCAYQVLCTPRPNYFQLPLEAGCYDTAAAKTTLKKFWDKVPQERGFQWMYMGQHTLHMKYYVYVTGSWEIQASMGQYLEFGAKKLDIWVRMKFEGPQFYPEDKGKTNRIVVDSISFVEL